MHSLAGQLFHPQDFQNFLRGLSQKRNILLIPLTGDLPGFLGGPAGPQGGGGPAQKAAPGGMRGKWGPAVPALPSLLPAEGSWFPGRPVLWSAPGKEMEERSGQLQRVFEWRVGSL